MEFKKGYFVAVILSFGIISSIANEMSKDDMKELMMGLTEDCMKKSGATEEHVGRLMNKELPDDEISKEYTTCAFETFGIFSNGKIEKDVFIQLSSMGGGDDEEKAETIIEISKICAETTSEIYAELAVELLKCLQSEAEKRDFTF